jgi:hypothetical protein
VRDFPSFHCETFAVSYFAPHPNPPLPLLPPPQFHLPCLLGLTLPRTRALSLRLVITLSVSGCRWLSVALFLLQSSLSTVRLFGFVPEGCLGGLCTSESH